MGKYLPQRLQENTVSVMKDRRSERHSHQKQLDCSVELLTQKQHLNLFYIYIKVIIPSVLRYYYREASEQRKMSWVNKSVDFIYPDLVKFSKI